MFIICDWLVTGSETDTSVCRRTELQWMAVTGSGGHGAGSDGHTGHVEQRLISQTIATLQFGDHQTLYRQGMQNCR